MYLLKCEDTQASEIDAILRSDRQPTPLVALGPNTSLKLSSGIQA